MGWNRRTSKPKLIHDVLRLGSRMERIMAILDEIKEAVVDGETDEIEELVQ